MCDELHDEEVWESAPEQQLGGDGEVLEREVDGEVAEEGVPGQQPGEVEEEDDGEAWRHEP